MDDACNDDVTFPKDPAGFFSTRWSMVITAGDPTQPDARAALEHLFAIYWQPIYGYVRRRGYTSTQAEDLTQGFLVMLLERGELAKASPDRGRFRSFLLTAVKHFLLNELVREQALKRGGNHSLISLDVTSTEDRLRLEPQGEVTPEAQFERQWALTLLEQVRQLLRAEYAAADKLALFSRLEGLLTGSGLDAKYTTVAAELGLTEGAIKTAAHRLRHRFGELLRQEIAQTVVSPEDVDAEIRDLFEALRN